MKEKDEVSNGKKKERRSKKGIIGKDITVKEL